MHGEAKQVAGTNQEGTGRRAGASASAFAHAMNIGQGHIHVDGLLFSGRAHRSRVSSHVPLHMVSTATALQGIQMGWMG